jgi:ParB-like nuclease domain
MPKSYSSNKTYSQNYLKRVKYIPCEESSLPGFLIHKNYHVQLNWFFKSKVLLDDIKLPENSLESRDWIDKETINNIVNDFYPSGWEAVRVNPKMEILDGYHRLVAAKKLGLKYIDIIIDYEPMFEMG